MLLKFKESNAKILHTYLHYKIEVCPRERPLMTSHVFWPFLTYILTTLSYSIMSNFGGYLGPPLPTLTSDVINGRSSITLSLKISIFNKMKENAIISFYIFFLDLYFFYFYSRSYVYSEPQVILRATYQVCFAHLTLCFLIIWLCYHHLLIVNQIWHFFMGNEMHLTHCTLHSDVFFTLFVQYSNFLCIIISGPKDSLK